MADDQIVVTVRALINQHDPEGLLAAGAPDDEYDPEVSDLAALVCGKDEITAAAVGSVWNRWFNMSPNWCTREPEQVNQIAAALARLRDQRDQSAPR
ncbi:hypothetical protein ACIBEJ_39640 [Nonomuraea sp. NPDC050790]|uniref:hypothetical protein n=1 Tax=Nonomuraea sp. NPDC050790 TaxID=3364371 RepID=UPI00378AAB8C